MQHHNKVTGVTFIITITKLFIPVVILSINNKIKFLEHFEQGFKRTISWNKHRSEISKNLDYLIYSAFRNIKTVCSIP